jgi:diaminopimelate epimerase
MEFQAHALASKNFDTFAFYKIQGCGNSFIVVKSSDISHIDIQNPTEVSKFAQKMCSQPYGVGTDGLMIVGEITTDSHNKKCSAIGMYNPDGSWMGMCGNGIRCVMRYLFEIGMLHHVAINNGDSNNGDGTDAESVFFQVGTRQVVCSSSDGGHNVTVNMGQPELDMAALPALFTEQSIKKSLQVGENNFFVTCVGMGNPHCVLFLEKNASFTDVDCALWGPLIEHHNMFPLRINVEFATIYSRNDLKVVVWERGAGMTLACGTGACATLVAGVLRGLCDRKASVQLPGGVLYVEWMEDSNEVLLQGPTEVVCRGEFILT